MRETFIIGVGMTPFGRHPDKTCADLARMAVQAALSDAGAQAQDIGAVYYANTAQGAIEGQYGMKGQHALRPIGFGGMPFINVENACSGSSSALYLACMQVAAGLADVALAVGTEKLHTEDRDKRLAAFSQPSDVEQVSAFVSRFTPLADEVKPPPSTVIENKARSMFMDSYAIQAKLHMKRHGTTWRQIAAVSAKNHHHSTMNPLSQYQHDMSVDEILGARVISWPLTLPMCAPVSDGGAAAIVCSREALDRLDGRRAVRICAATMTSGTDRDVADVEHSAVRRAAKAAYAQAGIEPKDISVAEVHDASAYAEIAQIELTGLCEIGQGGPFTESGATSLGGRIPVNVSGGLESKGHPVGATGLGQIHELVAQLRGEAGARTVEGARYALACNAGGFIGVEDGVVCVTILGTGVCPRF
jgi:acetyl-CoA acetyltransferase